MRAVTLTFSTVVLVAVGGLAWHLAGQPERQPPARQVPILAPGASGDVSSPRAVVVRWDPPADPVDYHLVTASGPAYQVQRVPMPATESTLRLIAGDWVIAVQACVGALPCSDSTSIVHEVR
jgi:hypothetical protein